MYSIQQGTLYRQATSGAVLLMDHLLLYLAQRWLCLFCLRVPEWGAPV